MRCRSRSEKLKKNILIKIFHFARDYVILVREYNLEQVKMSDCYGGLISDG